MPPRNLIPHCCVRCVRLLATSDTGKPKSCPFPGTQTPTLRPSDSDPRNALQAGSPSPRLRQSAAPAKPKGQPAPWQQSHSSTAMGQPATEQPVHVNGAAKNRATRPRQWGTLATEQPVHGNGAAKNRAARPPQRGSRQHSSRSQQPPAGGRAPAKPKSIPRPAASCAGAKRGAPDARHAVDVHAAQAVRQARRGARRRGGPSAAGQQQAVRQGQRCPHRHHGERAAEAHVLGAQQHQEDDLQPVPRAGELPSAGAATGIRAGSACIDARPRLRRAGDDHLHAHAQELGSLGHAASFDEPLHNRQQACWSHCWWTGDRHGGESEPIQQRDGPSARGRQKSKTDPARCVRPKTSDSQTKATAAMDICSLEPRKCLRSAGVVTLTRESASAILRRTLLSEQRCGGASSADRSTASDFAVT
eukprot:363147-Chlamydomonas_euryale.AAC.1